MTKQNKNTPPQGARPATKKKVGAYVGPFDITVNRFSIRVECVGFTGLGLSGELFAPMPAKMTDAEWRAFREWLSKCPFDPDIYNRD